jgi:nucleoside-diphosphate-sugar epimerase
LEIQVVDLNQGRIAKTLPLMFVSLELPWRASAGSRRRNGWPLHHDLLDICPGSAAHVTGSVYLVTGGAGFLGINLCRFLLSRGHKVRTLDIASFDYPERNAVEALLGDVRDPIMVERALDQVGVVVHAAAALPLSDAAEIFSTNVEGARIVLESAVRRGIPRFINISSTAVYGIPDHHPIVESDRLQGVGPYGESKIKAEKLCEEARAKGLCVSQLRPKSFVGPERLGAFELLYEWAWQGRNFPVLGSGNNRYQLLDVEDLCEAILLCATADRECVNDTFNVAAKSFGTMRDNFQAVLDRAGHGKRVISLPEQPAIWMLKVLEFLRLSPLYQWIYETAGRDSFVSVERIESRLGFVPKYSNRDALIQNYDWYVAHRDEISRASGTSHRVAWKKGALALAKYLF